MYILPIQLHFNSLDFAEIYRWGKIASQSFTVVQLQLMVLSKPCLWELK